MYYLSMNPDYRRFEVVTTAARRLNETFSTPGNPDKIAKELDKTNVMVGIPHQYRLNVPHFLLRHRPDAARKARPAIRNISWHCDGNSKTPRPRSTPPCVSRRSARTA